MNYLEVLTAIFATFFFGIIFSLTGKKLIYSSFAGGLGWYTHLLFFKELAYSKTASFVISAVVITVFSEIIGRIEKTTVTSTLIPALIPLVPGGGIYYTMSFFVSTFSQILDRTIKYTKVLKKYRKFKEYKKKHKV